MDTEVLESMGFSNAEAKVYLHLIDLGSVRVGKIIERSGLQSSTVHNIINALVDKGFVSFVLIGKVKEYRAVDPQVLSKRFKERQKRFDSLLPELQKKFKFHEEQSASIFEGQAGVMSLLLELIEDAKPGDLYCFFSLDQSGLNEEIQNFFEKYDAKRKDKGLLVQGIAGKNLKPLFVNRDSISMKYVDSPIPSNISVCHGKIAMITWGDHPSGILIKSTQIANNLTKFFEAMWQGIQDE